MRHLIAGSSLALLALLFLPQASAQQDQTDQEREALRRRILHRVDDILAREVGNIRHEIEALLDRELGLKGKEGVAETETPPAEREHPAKAEHPSKGEHPDHPKKAEQPDHPRKPPAKVGEADEDDLDAESAKMRGEFEELGRLFEESMAAHTSGRYDEAIAGFKKIAEKVPDPDMKASATYNVACGYALKGDKTRALKWLQKSIEGGFTDVDHMLQDSDLESLRGLPAFKSLMDQARKAKAEGEGEEGEGDGDE